MGVLVTVVLSILMVIFVLVLVKNDLLISINKFWSEFPKFVGIILSITAIGCLIYIIVMEVIRFK